MGNKGSCASKAGEGEKAAPKDSQPEEQQQQQQKQEGDDSNEKSPAEMVAGGLDAIQTNLSELKKLVAWKPVEASEVEQQITDLNALQADTAQHSEQVRAALANLKANGGSDDDSRSRLQGLVDEWNSQAGDFQERRRKQLRRQVKMVKPDLGDEELDKILADGRVTAVCRQAMGALPNLPGIPVEEPKDQVCHLGDI